MQMNNYKLIAMDLDGTLTQHKSRLDEKNTAVLDRLKKRYACVMVGAGASRRIFDQMNGYPIDIIGNYGMQFSTVKNGEFVLVRSDSYIVDRNFFENAISKLREETGYTRYVGDNVEFHPSGAVTFPLLGTKAPLVDKLAFDPDGKKRSRIFDKVSDVFKDYNCFIGGSSSFDIVSKDYDKYKALMRYAGDKHIKKEEILFLGDDFKKGGNDEQIKLNGIDFIQVADYRRLKEQLEENNII